MEEQLNNRGFANDLMTQFLLQHSSSLQRDLAVLKMSKRDKLFRKSLISRVSIPKYSQAQQARILWLHQRAAKQVFELRTELKTSMHFFLSHLQEINIQKKKDHRNFKL